MIFSEIVISPPSRTARRDLPLQQKEAKPKQRNGGKRKQSSHLACFLPSPLSGSGARTPFRFLISFAGSPGGMPESSYARLGVFAKGVAHGLSLAGWRPPRIAAAVKKTDGATPTDQAVRDALAAVQAAPPWDDKPAPKHPGGAPKSTTPALDRALKRFVSKNRGRVKVTVAVIKKKIKAARQVSDSTVSRRLVDAGLAWMRRRKQTLLTEAHRVARVAFAKWVLEQRAEALRMWGYTDGTVFYLARSEPEKTSSGRMALGPFVWRMADGSDALYQDCVGPSSYAKAQGRPVRVWGMLANGTFSYGILPEGERMNVGNYTKVIGKSFGPWLQDAFWKDAKVKLVQDHERCLWSPTSLAAIANVGEVQVEVLENYPKSSQDLNAVETVWREIRARLAETEPTRMETRKDFLRRLGNAVRWCNKHRARYFLKLCQDQKERARDVLQGVPPGARTGH